MLTPFHELLQDAYRGKYAVGAFNCLSLENVLGAIRAAEQLRSPIILQLAEVQFPYSPIEMMAPIFLEAARKATVPVAVHLDHGQSIETCVRALKLGFQSVMIDTSRLPLAENIAETALVCRIARAVGGDVEAELGKVGDTGDGGEGTGDADPAIFTDVEESARFLEATHVDALAIAIGNQHGNYTVTPHLNIERLAEITRRNGIPLVLHGGSGTSDDDFRACIRNGIAKINVATAMQMAITDRVRDYLATAPKPNYIDMKEQIVSASCECVAAHMTLFGSNGKA